MEELKKGWSRRHFLGASATGLAGIAVMPAFAGGQADHDLKIGFIGLGRQGMFLLDGFLQIPGVQAVAACDLWY